MSKYGTDLQFEPSSGFTFRALSFQYPRATCSTCFRSPLTSVLTEAGKEVIIFYCCIFSTFYNGNFKHTKRLKKFGGHPAYIYSLDSTIFILSYFTYHVAMHLFILLSNHWRNFIYILQQSETSVNFTPNHFGMHIMNQKTILIYRLVFWDKLCRQWNVPILIISLNKFQTNTYNCGTQISFQIYNIALSCFIFLSKQSPLPPHLPRTSSLFHFIYIKF